MRQSGRNQLIRRLQTLHKRLFAIKEFGVATEPNKRSQDNQVSHRDPIDVIMLLSILGNILGNEDTNNDSSSLEGDGDLAGSLSDDELLPGSRNGGETSESVEGEDDIFGDLDESDTFVDEDSSESDTLLDGDNSFDDDTFGEGSLDDDALFDDANEQVMPSEDGEMASSTYSSETEDRVDEMETEVGSLVSTVNTVQSENEQISESLEEIEENIRKLLEVYEMVTQGVNPFIEGDSLSDTFGTEGPGSGGFEGQSLFDNGGGGDEAEDVSPDVTSADAEEFLDDGLLDDEFEDESNDTGDETSFEEFEEDGFDDDDSWENGTSDESTTADDELSFDALKEEYDSGEADWGDEDENQSGTDTEWEDEETDADEQEQDSLLESAHDLEEESDPEEPDRIDDQIETQPPETTAVDELPWDDGGRPYLEAIPSEYDTEFIVLDWMDYIVGEVGLDGAAKTVSFYQHIGWISEAVESYLQRVLQGFSGGPSIELPQPTSSLGLDHRRSLWWIEQIAVPEKTSNSYDQWVEHTVATRATNQLSSGTELRFSEFQVGGGDNSAKELLKEHDGTDSEGNDQAHTILIDEDDESEGESADECSVDADPVDEEDQMIWVDSDIVLSESGVEIRRGSDLDDSMDMDSETSDGTVKRTGDESAEKIESGNVKPVTGSNEQSDLEPWQVELIQSMMTPSEIDGGN